MKKAFIQAISYYLPAKQITNTDLVQEFPEWSAEKVAKKVGINIRHIVAENETAGDLAKKAAELLFEEHAILPKNIDFILLCTQSPDYFLPTTACVLQHELNIPTRAGALDFNLGCSGYVYGLALAKGLLVSGVAKNILLITSETYSKHIHQTDKGNRTIFGDAASATLISDTGFAEISEFNLGTDGSGADNLIVKTGGMRYSKPLNKVSIDENGANCLSDNLYMNGSEIFNFTIDIVPKLVAKTLCKNNLKQDEIYLFVFHQANKYMLNFLRKKLNIDNDKFYYHLENVGNTVSSTIPIALYHAQKENKLHGNILLAGFGVGYSWGATILKV
ncbi:MAG: ketoacyl-ACP synthase III [Bacteroidales bacterium]|jgi:3-oxoacyl-[acyl-carrier-protein] synthase-3|nr:ketoacyl-ACP synthase III [Bacteroidales bacterium]